MTTQMQSTKKKFIEQTDPPRPARETLPTMYDLPSENPEEPGVPDQFHIWQPELLTQTFRPPDYPSTQMLTASDLNLYYDVRQPTWYKRPDWYAVLDVPYLYEEQDIRLSYVLWQEGAIPYVVVELLSPGTEQEDLGLAKKRESGQPPTKWEVYEQILGVPYYVVFSRYTDELRAFELLGRRYREMALSKKRVWLPELKLGLGLWRGSYQGVERQWLRWYDTDDNWIPTLAEQAEQERQEKEMAQQRAERLLAQLKALGVDPEA